MNNFANLVGKGAGAFIVGLTVLLIFGLLLPVGALIGAIIGWWVLDFWFNFESVFGYTPWSFGAIVGFAAGMFSIRHVGKQRND